MQYQQLDVAQRATVVEKLLYDVQFGTHVIWTCPQETRVISGYAIDNLMAVDKRLMLKLIKKVQEGDNADGFLFSEFDDIAKYQIEEALSDYDCLPDGYTLEMMGVEL